MGIEALSDIGKGGASAFAPGSGGSSGPSKANFMTYPFGEGVGVNFYDENIGEVISLPVLTQVANAVATIIYSQSLYLSSVSGTGAGFDGQYSAGSPADWRINTGTTATGGLNLQATVTRLINKSYPIGKVDGYSGFASVNLSSLSTATDRFSVGVYPATLSGTHGFTYTDSVNSGKWVATYKNAANVAQTVNTTIAPSTSGGPQKLKVSVTKEGAGIYRLVMSIGGVEVVNTTDCWFSANQASTAILGYSQAYIVKSVGTTNRTLQFREIGARFVFS